MEVPVLCAKITIRTVNPLAVKLFVKKKTKLKTSKLSTEDNRIIIINLFLTSVLFTMNCRLVTPALFEEAWALNGI